MNKKILTLVTVVFYVQFNTFSQQPKSPLVESYTEYLQAKNSTLYNLDWIQLGPTINGARVESVQVDPNNPTTMYVAFGSGNLWKTENNGQTWKPIFEDQPVLGIGDIALAPSNSILFM